ncbi:MAG: radical SAM family heme chaperone HemW [Desulfomonilaceae bacterium]|jgi:oxygen-independent coproporphyrinogen-3 oxidase
MKSNNNPISFPVDSSPIGVYIHIPFCLSRCDYCGFVSYPSDPNLESRYLKAVTEEISGSDILPIQELEEEPRDLDTIYIGGGTPSVLSPQSLNQLVASISKKFNLVHPVEITIEVNPGIYREEEFFLCREIGINRISIGAQSLNDQELKAMGRRHSVDDFLRTFHAVRSAGFDNVSVDLLAGYPGQTLKSVMNSLKGIIELEPEHISVYLLEVKGGSKLEKSVTSRDVELLDDDLIADMYEAICQKLGSVGFQQYEISNFSKQGMESKHNLKYWTDQVFLGFGAAAHGMTGRTRYANTETLQSYIEGISSKRPITNSMEDLDPVTRLKDALIMGLRLNKGVDLALMGSQYGFDACLFVKETLCGLENLDLFVIERDCVKLTDRGRLLSNIIFSRFV